MKAFGVKFLIIFKKKKFVTLESMTYLRPSAKVSFILIITFELIVVPCDLCPIIAYANVIMIFYNNIHHMYIFVEIYVFSKPSLWS
jgi:hypothetical protein